MWEHFDDAEQKSRLAVLEERSRAQPPDPMAIYVRGVRLWRLGKRQAAERLLRSVGEYGDSGAIPAYVLPLTPKRSNRGFNDLYRTLRENPSDLESVSREEDEWRVHFLVAGNPNTPVTALRRLTQEDVGGGEAAYAAMNFGAPDSFYKWVAARADGEHHVLAENPAIPVSVMRRLGRSKEVFVRECLAGNYSLPTSLISTLAVDRNRNVRLKARANPFAAAD